MYLKDRKREGEVDFSPWAGGALYVFFHGEIRVWNQVVEDKPLLDTCSRPYANITERLALVK